MEKAWRTIMEPFRVKAVEPLGFTTRAEREQALRDAGYNLFSLPADKVLIDLLTDSGASAMSAEQWAALMRGDESFAGARSLQRLEAVVRELTGHRHVLAVLQGRAAARALVASFGGKGKVFLSNSFLDTARACVEAAGGQAVDLPLAEALAFDRGEPFKGDVDVEALEAKINESGAPNVPMVVMTLTNNALGGQPVSMGNLRAASEICRHYKIPLIIDAARFAENAMLIKKREPGFATRPVREIAREMFSYAQGCFMSADKDGLVSGGGFLALSDADWARRAREAFLVGEGFPGEGVAGRDLEAMACGLEEALDERHLEHRMRLLAHLAEGLRAAGVPIVEPPGGHAVYVDAKRFLPHVSPEGFPGQALACELYLTAGIRAAEIGSLKLGRRESGRFVPARMELVRLAVPRRAYTRAHVDFVIEVFADLAARAGLIRPLRLLEGPETLRHFSARLMPEPV